MKVNVTKADIKKAHKLHFRGGDLEKCCPISLAIKRTRKKQVETDGFGEVSIRERHDQFCFREFYFKPAKPKAVMNFINKFDKGNEVNPAIFEFKPNGKTFGMYPKEIG